LDTCLFYVHLAKNTDPSEWLDERVALLATVHILEKRIQRVDKRASSGFSGLNRLQGNLSQLSRFPQKCPRP
jgi:hypothetical protein